MKQRTLNWIAVIIILALIWMAIMLAIWTLGVLIKVFFYAVIFAVITLIVIKIYNRIKRAQQ